MLQALSIGPDRSRLLVQTPARNDGLLSFVTHQRFRRSMPIHSEQRNLLPPAKILTVDGLIPFSICGIMLKNF